jgi:hypothetical protein
VGDFNGDGKPDLVMANSEVNSVSLLLGNGDGSFQMHVDYATGNALVVPMPLSPRTGTDPAAVVVGDLNRDDKADLAITNYGDNTVSVLLGNGDGTFHAHVDYPTGNHPGSVAIGDFNGDGQPDLAVANAGDYQNPRTVRVLLGDGEGRFQVHVSYPTDDYISSISRGI